MSPCPAQAADSLANAEKTAGTAHISGSAKRKKSFSTMTATGRKKLLPVPLAAKMPASSGRTRKAGGISDAWHAADSLKTTPGCREKLSRPRQGGVPKNLDFTDFFKPGFVLFRQSPAFCKKTAFLRLFFCFFFAIVFLSLKIVFFL